MARILFVQPSLNPPGGGNIVAAWMIETLKREHAITLMTLEAPELERINGFAGTALRRADFDLQLFSPASLRLADLSPTPLWLVRNLYLMRAARKRRHPFDLVISANNEGDFGEPALQYVHYPAAPSVRPEADLRWFNRPWLVRYLYYTAARALFGWRRQRVLGAVTLANSDYIADLFASQYGRRPVVCHPPAPGAIPEVAWEQRRDAFACIGRFHPVKRLDQVVEIIAQVRASHPQVELNIIGTDDGASALTTWLRQRAAVDGDWLHLHEGVDRSTLLDIVSHCRFGIHAMVEEHFGMAVAELIRAGAVPFVHGSGGPAEIVPIPELQFDSPEAAIQRIRRVLDDATLLRRVRDRLAARRADLSTERFQAQVRAAVARALGARPPGPAAPREAADLPPCGSHSA
jgi:glycosyltransferase involved in cell wall biosynthesis